MLAFLPWEGCRCVSGPAASRAFLSGSHVHVLMAKAGVSVKRRPDGPTVTTSALALAFPTDVYRVRIDLAPGASLVRSTKMLSLDQAKKASLEHFRVLTLRLSGRGLYGLYRARRDLGGQGRSGRHAR